jgi:hypothetical protein
MAIWGDLLVCPTSNDVERFPLRGGCLLNAVDIRTCTDKYARKKMHTENLLQQAEGPPRIELSLRDKGREAGDSLGKLGLH